MDDRDFVTPRELYDRLVQVDEKLDNRLALIEASQDAAAEKQAAHEKDDERRFGRIEKGLALLAVAVLSPKFGGPDVSHVVSVVVSSWLA